MSKEARRFIILLGWVSLFADLCYEGMRSAIGPYLALLGASATAVGIVAGTGEAIGYGLRYASGSLADRTKRYWTLAIAGYAANLIAVPLLAFAGSWPMVAALVGLERLGKAVRSPAKSTLTSFAASKMGAGKVFAITEAMDQIGGLLGPLLVAAVLAWRGDSASGFAWAFALLAIPAAITLAVLMRARAGCIRIRARSTRRTRPTAAGSDRATGSTSSASRSSRSGSPTGRCWRFTSSARASSARAGCRSRTPPRWVSTAWSRSPRAPPSIAAAPGTRPARA